VRELKEQVWKERLQRAAKALKIDLARLPPRKSAPEKVCLAALLKACTPVSDGWLANRLAMGQPASVSQFVRRFRLGGEASTPAFLSASSIVKSCPLFVWGVQRNCEFVPG
jgi:hypothetical protein